MAVHNCPKCGVIMETGLPNDRKKREKRKKCPVCKSKLII